MWPQNLLSAPDGCLQGATEVSASSVGSGGQVELGDGGMGPQSVLEISVTWILRVKSLLYGLLLVYNLSTRDP